jgi:predicted DNA-binding ArsR family transcriptional regulator
MVKNIIKIIKDMGRLLIMTFTRDSRIVRSYVILILAGEMTLEEVPNIYNLREMVALVLAG